MNVGSLFSGIGGFDLGLERAGMQTAWQVELDPFCRRVLERHFPDAERYADVREVGTHNLASVDLVCGGFPCQDISLAGRGAGIDGERSGLWSEFARLIGELRPRYVVVENVPALLGRGAGRVLGDLATLGYDAEWDCLPASAFGAPHQRDRFWVVAYPDSSRGAEQRWQREEVAWAEQPHVDGTRRLVAEPEGDGRGQGWPRGSASPDGQNGQDVSPQGMADSEFGRRSRRPHFVGGDDQAGDAAERGETPSEPAGCDSASGSRSWTDFDPWAVEPDVGRVADGVPARVDRLRSLGNSLVPQIAEWIGRRLIAYESALLQERKEAANE